MRLKPWHRSKAAEAATGSTPCLKPGACAPLSGQRGHRCLYCSKNKPPTQKEILGKFESNGWTLLDSYEHSHKLMNFVCDRGHQHKISWTKIQSGDKCAICSNRLKPTLDKIRNAFEERGWKLTTTHYENKKQLLYYICDKGHHHQKSWAEFRAGTGCFYCSSSNNGFKNDKPAVLYYIKFTYNDKNYYKIGITNATIKERFRKEPLPYKIIYQEPFIFGWFAYQKEQSILRKYKTFKYRGANFLKSGNTELFTKDVLKLDTKA